LRHEKNEMCLTVRLAFLVQMLMFCSVFRIMHNGLVYEK
jgi:hypothetical protein